MRREKGVKVWLARSGEFHTFPPPGSVGRKYSIQGVNNMKAKTIRNAVSLSVASALLLTMLGGCQDNDRQTEQDTSSSVSEAVADTGRKDGERFEDVILLEGDEETVQYEHVKNEEIGFELDFEYESFHRMSGSDYERFVSVYEDAKKPEIYLEITYSSEKADNTVKKIKADLSKKYKTVTVTSSELTNAGQCRCIDASAGKGGKAPKDSVQTVTVIPAGDGCIVAAAHYTIESAEGFGRRFSYMVDTLSVID